jgi:hypothetical protein
MMNLKLAFGFLFGIFFALAGCKTAAPAAPAATPGNAQTGAPTATQANATQSLGGAAEPALKPASAAAGAWGMSLVVASPMRVVADLDALSKSLQLPMPLGQSFLPTLTSGFSPGGVKVARETLARLDVARPVAVIWLARGSGVPAGWCAALAFKERAFALDALQGIGTGAAQSEGTFERRLPSGDLVWGAVKERQLLLSSSRETLLAAGALAITTQGTPMPGQALFTVSTAAMARSTGQSLDVLATGIFSAAMAEMEKDASRTGKPLTPASKKMTEAVLKALVRPLSEIAVVRVSLEIGDRRGVLVRAEVQPTQGSGLAAKVAAVSPYVFDPALPVRSDASAVVAWGDMAPWLEDWAGVMEASGPAGRAASRDLALFRESMSGGSCAVEVGSLPMVFLCSLTVRPGVDPARALARNLAVIESSNAWEAELDGRKPTPLKVKRTGKIIETEKPLAAKDARVLAMVKAVMGGSAVHTALTVKDGRVVLAVGRNPHELLDRYGKAQAFRDDAAPILKRTLLETAGAQFLGALDMASILRKGIAQSEEPMAQQFGAMMAAVPGLADLYTPLVLSGRSGTVAAIEFQVPFGSLRNVSRVVSAFMGQMGTTPGH